MLVACRLAGLSALEAYYADVNADAQFARAGKNRIILRTEMRTGSSVAGALSLPQLSICWSPLDLIELRKTLAQLAQRWARTASNISVRDA